MRQFFPNPLVKPRILSEMFNGCGFIGFVSSLCCFKVPEMLFLFVYLNLRPELTTVFTNTFKINTFQDSICMPGFLTKSLSFFTIPG